MPHSPPDSIDNYTSRDVFRAVREKRASHIVFSADRTVLQERLRWALLEQRLLGVAVLDLTTFYQAIWHYTPLKHIDDQWLLWAGGFEFVDDSMAARLKRVTDVVMAAAALLLAFPISTLIAVAIRLDSSGPVFYGQERVGLRGRSFRLWKFRSMLNDCDDRETTSRWTKKDDRRITAVGRSLRATRLDEIPQFWNVLKGT